MSQLTRLVDPSFDICRVSISSRASMTQYFCSRVSLRKWKSVTWAQIASFSDDTKPLVKACEVKDGLQVLKTLGAIIVDEGSEGASGQ